MRRRHRYVSSAILAALVAASPASKAGAEIVLSSERIATGLSRPVYVTAAPGDTDRLFIVEQRSGSTGRIRILDLSAGTVNATPFLEVSPVTTGNEQGLLGMAFHPDYQSNGLFYLNYTTTGGGSAGRTVVERYTVSGDPDVADPTSAQTVITYNQPASNHNAGWMDFGPNDGYLYISSGDGGVRSNAQPTNTLLGKMLRIDVNADAFPGDPDKNYAIPPDNPLVGKAGLDEIWANGLRNPWRDSFDRKTGDLWIADVGQGSREEINFQPASSTGGENYGWPAKEGTLVTGNGSVPPGAVDPIYEYAHPTGFAIVGGYVYRGTENLALRGTYFFADNVTDKIWSFRYDGAAVTDFRDRTAELAPAVGTINSPSSFGEDALGNIYITDLDGEIYRIVPPPVGMGDADLSGCVDDDDLSLLLANWGTGDEWGEGDLNESGTADDDDLSLLLANWGAGCSPAPGEAIPEPATLALLVFGGLALIRRR